MTQNQYRHKHHSHCGHDLAYCAQCDRPYCKSCGKEWYSYHNPVYTTSPWIKDLGGVTTTGTATFMTGAGGTSSTIGPVLGHRHPEG